MNRVSRSGVGAFGFESWLETNRTRIRRSVEVF